MRPSNQKGEPVKDLNKAQLQNELMRRWGKRGWAEYRKDAARKSERDLIRTICTNEVIRKASGRHSTVLRIHGYPCTVGRITEHFGFREIIGQGDTWREAFAEVDRKIAREKERYAAERAEARA